MLYDLFMVGSPTPQKRNIIRSSQKESHNVTRSLSSDRKIHSQLDDIELPRETMYMIDKVVRQRAKKGPFGVDNSKLILD